MSLILSAVTWFDGLTLGAATFSVDVEQDVFVTRSREAGVVNSAGVDGLLVLSGHDQLDLTPHAVQVCVVGERPEVCDGADLLPVVPGPLQVHIFGVEVLHPAAEDQQPLHLGDLRNAGDLEEGWLHWRCVSGESVTGDDNNTEHIPSCVLSTENSTRHFKLKG